MFLWTSSRTVHKKGKSPLNPSAPKSLLSPPAWLCLGSEMPALMNTNFPIGSSQQDIRPLAACPSFFFLLLIHDILYILLFKLFFSFISNYLLGLLSCTRNMSFSNFGNPKLKLKIQAGFALFTNKNNVNIWL